MRERGIKEKEKGKGFGEEGVKAKEWGREVGKGNGKKKENEGGRMEEKREERR